VDKVDGDVIVANRKGKTILIFDLDIGIKFEAKAEKEKTIKGSLEFSIDIDDCRDFQVNITFDGESDDTIRNHLKNNTIPAVRHITSNWFNDMRDKFTKTSNAPSAIQTPKTESTTSATVSPVSQKPATNSKALTINIEFRAPKEELFNTIFDSNRITGVTQRPAKISKEVGGEFSLFGGSVTGTTIEIVPSTKIVQKWRSSSWPSGVLSTVTMELKNTADGCKITLKQIGVPDDDIERTETGWKQFYWEPMRMLFGEVNLC